MTRVSIITTCKGRLQFLRQSLPHWLNQECREPFDILVVDYGDPDGALDWCRGLGHPAVSCLRVLDDTERFHFSRGKNCGARHSAAEIFAFVDTDVQLPPGWLDSAVRSVGEGPSVLYRPKVPGAGELCGNCAVRQSTFHAVRGYDESFCGYGFEDMDFYNRCEAVGPVELFDPRQVAFLRHPDALRTRFCEEKDKRRSGTANRRRAAERTGPVNPLGYGQGTFEFWHPAGAIAAMDSRTIETYEETR